MTTVGFLQLLVTHFSGCCARSRSGGTGHGFGLEIHELPFLREKAKGILQAGQIITIEPGVYLPRKLGVRIEDDILITDSGCELLTGQCPRIAMPA